MNEKIEELLLGESRIDDAAIIKAYLLGQERMRERCVAFLNDPMRVDRALNDWKPDEMKAPYLANAIRALTVEE